MKNQSGLNWLVPLLVVLIVISAGAGLFWQTEGSPYLFNTFNMPHHLQSSLPTTTCISFIWHCSQ